MDDEEFEFDDIADEDLMLACDQIEDPSLETASSKPSSAHTTFREFDDVDLEGFPSDGSDGFELTGQSAVNRSAFSTSSSRAPQRSLGQSQLFRQTTLFGDQVSDENHRQSQSLTNRPFRADQSQDVPTHHALNPEALKTWVYPMNLGPVRDYQFSIVKTGLFNNTLVALPTGLGKTFIAAAIILNFYRWTQKAKIVFVAPTKPLVSQQVDACLNIAGIPRSDTTLLTGETPAGLREGEWETKRLFFMTPQTLINDLSKGYADPKSIVLLVVDEAHRATGDYAYVKVVEFIRRFSKSFRVLALTATPGPNVETIQQVFDNLGISQVEVRSEDSIDIRKYVHSRDQDTIPLEPSDEMLRIQELFSKALKPFVNKLSALNIYWGRDPMDLTVYRLMTARKEWLNGPGRHVNDRVKWPTVMVFTFLQRLAHAIKLLTFHGIHLFYQNLNDFRKEVEEKGGKGTKLETQLLEDKDFQEMMNIMGNWLKKDDFVTHPKIPRLCDTLLTHFLDAGAGSSTRAIVFSEYRDSAEAIVKALNAHRPLIKAAVFVGQQDSKRSAGMKQKQQIEAIEKFKSGGFNVLVATSIGEEGLDIGQVDLIVCYDSSSSPIRMLQRMGRTGRKRAGKVVLLVMKGKEEGNVGRSKDNYKWIQKALNEGNRFKLRHDISSRILPRDIRPEVDKQTVDIPIENTQDRSLPEPKKTAAGLRKKASKKKFHMPDGAETGFQSVATMLNRPTKPKAKASKKPQPVVEEPVADAPPLDSVCLTKNQEEQLARVYKYVPYQGVNSEEIVLPDVTRFPHVQRELRPTAKLRHGAHTKRCVRLFKLLGNSQDPAGRFVQPYADFDPDGWKQLPVPSFAPNDPARDIRQEEEDGSETEAPIGRNSTSASKRPSKRTAGAFVGDEDDEEVVMEDASEEEEAPAPAARGRGGARGGRGGRGGRGAATSTRGGRKPPVKKKSKQGNSFFMEDLGGNNDDDDEEEASDDEGMEITRIPANRGKGRGRGGRSARGGRGGLKRKGDHFEDLGDDCERTSDIDDTDGSDNGSDLDDFVVGDDQPISSIPSSLPTSFLPSSAQAPKEDPQTAGWMDLTATQDSMPDIDELLGVGSAVKAAKRKTSPFDVSDDDQEGGEEDDDVVRRPVATTKRRRVLADSDDE
ncbi:ATP-dependent DNA helicase mph1 [Coniochaeta sp. 2T2.1]|nr:ATP-dependent DNA helicase mph1 [Coniochaeta sp. 2T2.1]